MSARSSIVTQLAGITSRESRRILVTGDPGIGKSTMLDSAVDDLRPKGLRILRANPSSVEHTLPYSTLWELISALDWENGSIVEPRYRKYLLQALDTEASRFPDGQVAPLGVAVAAEKLLASAARERPTVLVVDDIQWADSESLAVLSRALRRLDAEPLYLIATERADPDRASSARIEFAAADTLQMPGLSGPELAQLARETRSTTLTRAQADALREHTDGNPMWARELILRGQAQLLGAMPVGSVRAPATLAHAVDARLEALSEASREIVSVVALLGRTNRRQVESILGRDTVTDTMLGEAERAGILEVTTEDIRVSHPLLATAGLSRLAVDRRRDLHRAIAAVTTHPELRAQHLEQSEPPGPDEHIATALIRAAKVTGSRGAPMRAAQFLTQALERTDGDCVHTVDVTLERAQYLATGGDYSAAAAALSAADESEMDLKQLDLYAVLMSASLRHSEGAAQERRFLAEQSEFQKDRPRRRAVLEAMRCDDSTIPALERVQIATDVLNLLTCDDAPNAIRRATAALFRSEVDLGRGVKKDLVELAERCDRLRGPGGLEETGAAQLAFAAADLDDLSGARAALSDLAALAATSGEEGTSRIIALHSAAAELLAGDISAASEYFESTGYAEQKSVWHPSVLAVQGLLHIANSDWKEFESMIAADRQRVPAPPATRQLVQEGLLGLAFSARDEWAPAVTHLREAAHIGDRHGLVELGRRFRVDIPLIEALFRVGENREASERLGVVRDFLRHHDRPISQIGLHRMNALESFAKGDYQAALDETSRAVQLARATGGAVEETYAVLQRCRILKRVRRRSEALQQLAEAKKLAARTGNSAIIAATMRAESTFAAARSSSDLTAAEQRVLDQVRLGSTNREASTALFISVRTVESHVASIMRKRGATSRTKLIISD